MPIIPGLKFLDHERHLADLPRNFHVNVPAPLADEAASAPDHAILDLGVEWAERQVRELLDRGASSVHFYVMQSATAVSKVLARLGL